MSPVSRRPPEACGPSARPSPCLSASACVHDLFPAPHSAAGSGWAQRFQEQGQGGDGEWCFPGDGILGL